MLLSMLLLQLAVDDRVGVEIGRFCARKPTAGRAACADAQARDARRTFEAAGVGDETTPAAIGRCLERSRRRGVIDWTRAAACAHAHARAHPAPADTFIDTPPE